MKITILIPAYNEAESIGELNKCMQQVASENVGYEWEFLIVNDGSTDNTLNLVRQLNESDPRYHYIDLSRNYGKEIAIMAGLDHVDSDAVIMMDADMQHPVSIIPEMIRYWKEGYDDVYAQRQTSDEPWFRRQTSRLYYRILQKSTDIPIQKDTGDFRLLDRRCIVALRQMREVDRNNKGMFSWIGYRKKAVTYAQHRRRHGHTKWSTLRLLNLALTGLTSFTTAPLRFASVFGIVVSLLAFCYLAYIVVKTILYGDPVRGYPTLMVTILFLGGIQLIAIGIIGEYLSHIFNETKKRPGYFVREYR